jgi:23S rRNA (guanosine2251-2'-O)-methyltransferase
MQKEPSVGASRAISRESRKSSKPLSGAAKKAIAGRYDKQAEKSDEGRRRTTKSSSRSTSATSGTGSGRSAGSGAARSTGAGSGRSAGASSAARRSGGGWDAGAGRGAGRSASSRGPRQAGYGGGPDPQMRPAPTRDRGLGGEQVEGRQAVRELLIANKRKVRELWIAAELEDSGIISEIADLAAANRVQITEVNRRRLDDAAKSESPQGVLARAVELEETEYEELLLPRNGEPPFLLAVDGVTDPGNLGALLRSAEGAGVTGVVLPKHRTVHITPTAAKAAAGAIEHLDMAVVAGLPAAMTRATQKKVWIVGLDDAADKDLFELGDLATEPIMIVLGAEGSGLSRLVRDRCDMIVSIPMLGRLSSLNVSTAGALAMYEIRRQRVASAKKVAK